MSRIQCRLPLLVVLILVLGWSACTKSEPDLCCLQYPAESDEATYCNNHRDAVGKFVRSAQDVDEQRTRLNHFQTFYQTIKDCESVECIEGKINSDTTLPGFRERYETEHAFAEQDTQIAPELKAHLILCGFRHAINALEETMKTEGE